MMGILRNLNRLILVSSFLISTSILVSANGEGTPSINWEFDPFWTADQWFKQKLDHYDSSNVQYWPQRYITSYRFYRLGGPVYLHLSGPGPELALSDIESGAIAEYAQEQGAFVIGLEHRFYGKSRPTDDLSTKNLHFLTVPQTLEDIAAFVRQWRSRDEFKHSKWVIFGASYLGSVATWFAQKHPELVDAFVASSPPLELRYEIPEFLENVGHVLNKTDTKCYDTISEGFKCLQNIFNEQGCQNYTLNEVKSKFNLCADLDPSRPLDASGAIAELFSTVNAVVMYHDPSPDSFPDTNLDRFCKHITADNGKSPLDKLGEKVKEINKHRKIPCAEFRFETTVQFLDEKEWDSDAAKEGYRQLQWQLCNELGWTVASANISQPFGNYLSPFLHAEICQKLFGLTETEMRLKVLQANTDLKGKNIQTQCGIFVNGDLDPWHTYSITTADDAGKCNRALLIEGGSHGRDIEDFTGTPSYPPSVRETQVKISRYLDYFLKTGKCCDDDPPFITSPINIFRSSRPVRNVVIRPRGEPRNDNIASPTALPRMVSTTDILSVSPRIPVSSEDIYRDPRTSEMRRYRVVKLLRHRPSFTPPEMVMSTSPAPSMEQFEAEFPEHSLKVEGRVERVFKNGTKIESEDEKNWKLFSRGREHLLQEHDPKMNSISVTPTPQTLEDDGGDEEEAKRRFKYVVKQVFRDVVDEERRVASSPANLEDEMRVPMSVSYQTEEESDGGSSARKRESEEIPTMTSPRTPRKNVEVSVKVSKSAKSQSQSQSTSVSKRRQENDDEEDDYDYDDDEYSDEDEGGSHANERFPVKKMNSSSTEYTSGEDFQPVRLREKISEKIRSSTETVEGDQRSKEKTGNHEDNDDFSDSDEDYDFSLEPSGSNPEGHFRKTSKKQLKPIVKPAHSEPSTVINVEISGSYPKRNSYSQRRKKKKTTTTTTTTEFPVSSSESDSNSLEEIITTSTTTTKKPKRRIVVRRRKIKSTTTTTSTTEAPTTTSTTTTSTTTEAPSKNKYATWSRENAQVEQEQELEAKPLQQEPPKVIDLNPGGYESLPTEVPQKSNDNGDVIYIVIGDIPQEDNEVESGPPSADALFRFIQKLVNRHSNSGGLQRKAVISPEPQPQPLYQTPTPPSTFTSLPPPTPPPSFYLPQQLPLPESPAPGRTNLGFDEHTGKFILVRPVQIVPLGRERVVRPHDLRNESFLSQIAMEHQQQQPPPPQQFQQRSPPPQQFQQRSPPPQQFQPQLTPQNYQFQFQPPQQQLQFRPSQPEPTPKLNRETGQGRIYEFKSPNHRTNFERLLSVDDQVRDSDRRGEGNGRYRNGNNNIDRRLIPDPTWRSIRGISQFGPAIPPSAQGLNSGVLSLTAADTQWVNDGIPFLPRGNKGLFRRSVK